MKLLGFGSSKKRRQEVEINDIKGEIRKVHNQTQSTLKRLDKALTNGVAIKIYYSMGKKNAPN